MSEERVIELTCIICPMGCQIKVYLSDNKVVKVEGNTCPRGEAYAREEVTDPKRVIMSVVRCTGGELPTVSVKTREPIPKRLRWKLMRKLRDIVLKAPVKVGEIILEDPLDIGIPVVATRECKPIRR